MGGSSIFREGLSAAALGPSTELGGQAHRAPGTRLSDDGMTPFSPPQATSSWVSSRPLPREVALGRDCGGLWAPASELLELVGGKREQGAGAEAKALTCGWARRAGSHGRGWRLWRG